MLGRGLIEAFLISRASALSSSSATQRPLSPHSMLGRDNGVDRAKSAPMRPLAEREAGGRKLGVFGIPHLPEVDFVSRALGLRSALRTVGYPQAQRRIQIGRASCR